MKTNQHAEIFVQYLLDFSMYFSDFMEFSAVTYSPILPVDTQEGCQEPVLLLGILILEMA